MISRSMDICFCVHDTQRKLTHAKRICQHATLTLLEAQFEPAIEVASFKQTFQAEVENLPARDETSFTESFYPRSKDGIIYCWVQITRRTFVPDDGYDLRQVHSSIPFFYQLVSGSSHFLQPQTRAFRIRPLLQPNNRHLPLKMQTKQVANHPSQLPRVVQVTKNLFCEEGSKYLRSLKWCWKHSRR